MHHLEPPRSAAKGRARGFSPPLLTLSSTLLVSECGRCPYGCPSNQSLSQNPCFGHFVGCLCRKVCRIGPKNRRYRQRLATKVADKVEPITSGRFLPPAEAPPAFDA